MNNKKPPLFLLVGPTGVGKTQCSINLAKMLNAEIISCDSMQIYRKMDIGTAKIKKEEMQGVVHHLIDIKNPDEKYSVCDFVNDAKKAEEEIRKKGKNVLVVGGTGLYADSYANGSEFEENKSDEKIRENLNSVYLEKGADYIYSMLEKYDPESALVIHKNNVKRVIRAIEYYLVCGEKISDHNKKDSMKPSPYDLCYIGLTRNREELYERIDKRVDMMMEEGLIEEVMNLYSEGINLSHNSMQALGYKEIMYYIKGKCTLDEAVRILKRDSRHYAKRQLTWFKRNKNINWINLSEENDKLEILLKDYCSKVIENI